MHNFLLAPGRANKAIFFLLIYFLFSQLILGLIAYIFDWDMSVTIILGQVIGLGLPFLAYLLITKQKFKDVIPSKGLTLKNVLIVTLISFTIIPMVNLISFFSSFVFYPLIFDILEDTSAPIWLTFISIGILPSLFDQFWFRGVMYTKYRMGGVSILKTALITGLFFGLIHFNFHQAIYATVIGILYAFIVYYTRSIWYVVLAHLINNGLSVLLTYSNTYMEWYSGLSTISHILIMGGASVLMTPILLLCLRELKKYRADTMETHGEDVDSIPTEIIAEQEAKPIEKANVYTWGFWASLVIMILISIYFELNF